MLELDHACLQHVSLLLLSLSGSLCWSVFVGLYCVSISVIFSPPFPPIPSKSPQQVTKMNKTLLINIYNFFCYR